MMKARTRMWGGTLLVAGLLAVGQAQAVGLDAWDKGFAIDFNEQWLREDAYNRAMQQARKDMRPLERGGQARPNVKTDILFTGALVKTSTGFLDMDGVYRLVELFPREQRNEAKDLFVNMIHAFNGSVEKLYDVPKENVATGLVALLAGAYAAYYNKPLDDRVVKPTVEQVGQFLRQRPELFQGKTDFKMNSYQMSVGMGTLLMMLQQEVRKKPNRAHEAELKAVGEGVFVAVLGVKPDQLRFTKKGIVFD